MIWKKHSDEVPNVRISNNAKILSKKAFDATLGKPTRSFVAFSDNILTLFIRKIKTPFESLAKLLILIIQCKFQIDKFQFKTKFNYFKYKFTN